MAVDTWKNFEMSGKVTDYLKYRQSMVSEEQKKEAVDTGVAKMEPESRGIGSYGTKYHSDGDDFKCNANGRI